MTDTKTPAGRLASLPAEFQKFLPLVDAHTFGEGLIRAYARATTEPARDAALDAIGEYSRVLQWIVAPLAAGCHGPAACDAVTRWAEQLKDFRRPWCRFHPTDFPPEPDRQQQILDAIEEVTLLLKRRQARNERRAA